MECKYGCGNEGKYQNKQGEWTCSKYWQQCPVKRKQTSEISKRTHNTKEFKEKAKINAINQFKNESLIDRQNRIRKVKQTCNSKEFIENSRNRSIEIWKDEELKNKMLEGIRKSKKDPVYRKLASNAAKKRFKNETPEEKLKRSLLAKEKSKQYFDNETNDQKLKRIRSKKRTIEKINKKYPLFSKIEEMRYNPDKFGEIQVKCIYCNKWFNPSNRQIESRIFSIENKSKDNSNFYCSDECKQKCCIFNSKGKLVSSDKYEMYIHNVYKLSNRNLEIFKNKIKFSELRGLKYGYDLDHKFSVYDGFINNINPEIISHWKNLRVIPSRENRSKGKNSTISINELLHITKEIN